MARSLALDSAESPSRRARSASSAHLALASSCCKRFTSAASPLPVSTLSPPDTGAVGVLAGDPSPTLALLAQEALAQDAVAPAPRDATRASPGLGRVTAELVVPRPPCRAADMSVDVAGGREAGDARNGEEFAGELVGTGAGVEEGPPPPLPPDHIVVPAAP